jgi:uncharacterized lipoprotein YajG
MLKRTLCLLIVVLILSGCASSPPVSPPPTKPSLDSALARPCVYIGAPETDDYDAWMDSYLGLIKHYADCAVKHRKLVEAWPK